LPLTKFGWRSWWLDVKKFKTKRTVLLHMWKDALCQMLFTRSGIQQLNLDRQNTLHGDLIEDDICGGSFAKKGWLLKLVDRNRSLDKTSAAEAWWRGLHLLLKLEEISSNMAKTVDYGSSKRSAATSRRGWHLLLKTG